MRNFSIHLLKFQYLEICQLYSSLKKLSCTDCLCSYLHTTRPIIIVPQFGFLEATELVLSCTIGFPISRRAMKVVCIIFFCSGWLGILGFVSPSVFFFFFLEEGGFWWFKFWAPRFRTLGQLLEMGHGPIYYRKELHTCNRILHKRRRSFNFQVRVWKIHHLYYLMSCLFIESHF